MQKCSDDVRTWMAVNKFNDNKTEAVMVSSGRKFRSLSSSFPDSVTISSASVPMSDCQKLWCYTWLSVEHENSHAKVCFDCVLVLCFVVGCVLQFGGIHNIRMLHLVCFFSMYALFFSLFSFQFELPRARLGWFAPCPFFIFFNFFLKKLVRLPPCRPCFWRHWCRPLGTDDLNKEEEKSNKKEKIFVVFIFIFFFFHSCQRGPVMILQFGCPLKPIVPSSTSRHRQQLLMEHAELHSPHPPPFPGCPPLAFTLLPWEQFSSIHCVGFGHFISTVQFARELSRTLATVDSFPAIYF